MRLNPVLAGLATYPFVRLTEAAARRAPAASTSSTSASASRARRRRPSSAGRWPRRSRPSRCRPTRRRRACPSCARRSPRWCERRFGAALDPATEVVPTLGSKEAIFHLAQVVGRARRPRGRRPRPAIRCPPAARCSRAREVVELPLDPSARLAARPRRGRLGRRRAAVAELPQQPDRGDGARPSCYERAAALAREHGFVAGLRRGLLRAVVRGRAAAQRAAGWPTARTSSSSTRSPSARRCPATGSGFAAGDPAARRRAQALPARTSASRRRPSSSARRSRRGATRTTSRDPRALRAPSATRCCPRCCRRPAARGRRRELLPVAARARGRGRRGLRAARCSTSAGIVVAPGPFFGPGGEGHVRVALVPTLEDCRARGRGS